ncbi:MAG TPA: hypothetical protein VMM60_17885 [Ilumatobacter sp.]|nr:hypothetical protein [Ilumatobacter sp.]
MDPDRRHHAAVAAAAAERLNQLADVADLMGDADGASRLRQQAASASERAMALLDE